MFLFYFATFLAYMFVGPQTSVQNLIRKSEEKNHWEDQDIDGDTIKFHL